MRASALIAAALLLGAIPSVAAAEPVVLSFGVPAQFAPAANVTAGEWALVVFSPVSSAKASWTVHDVLSITNRTRVYPRVDAQGYSPFGMSIPWPDATEDWTAQPSTLAFGQGTTSSVWIHAASVRASASSFDGVIGVSPAGLTPPPSHGAPHAYRDQETDVGDAFVALRTPGGASPLHIEATGVERLEWSGAAFSCPSGACPSGGRNHDDTANTVAGTAGLSWRSSVEAVVAGASALELDGTFDYAFIGGSRLDLAVNGTTRLPHATISDCAGCADLGNGTLTVTGNVALQGLRQSGSGMSATLEGKVGAAAVDETGITPASIGLSTLTTTGAVAGSLTGLGLIAAWLFTRLGRADATANPRRKRLHDLVLAQPGISFRELCRESGIAAGTARYHLTVLIRAGLIVEKRHGQFLRFLENHGRYEATWTRVSLIRDPELQQLHAWLSANGPSTQGTVLDGLQALHGWPRSTTQHRLARLVEGGLVSLRPQGRFNVYSALPVEGTGVAERSGASNTLPRPPVVAT